MQARGQDGTFRFGIEEEFFLADAETRSTPRPTRTAAFHRALKDRVPAAEREMMQSQVEISSPPATALAEAAPILHRLRVEVAQVARQHGLLLFAAGTHPMARWKRQRVTRAARYERILAELGMPGERNIVSGLHVHVEVPDPEARVDLMRRVLPFLPLLLALSASSPFWQRRDTGLSSYRLISNSEMPRTGLPDIFPDAAAYDRFLGLMTETGAIRDSSFLWWVIRPSKRYPTLELRVADSCTRLDDGLVVAALYRCLMRCLVRRPDLNADVDAVQRAVSAENLWRVQRHGRSATLIDPERRALLPVAQVLDETLALVAEDASALGHQSDLAHARAILAEGTSADRQLALAAEAREAGTPDEDALRGVVDWLAQTTLEPPTLGGTARRPGALD